MPISSTARQARRDAIQAIVSNLAAQRQVFTSVTQAAEAVALQALRSGAVISTHTCKTNKDLLRPILDERELRRRPARKAQRPPGSRPEGLTPTQRRRHNLALAVQHAISIGASATTTARAATLAVRSAAALDLQLSADTCRTHLDLLAPLLGIELPELVMPQQRQPSRPRQSMRGNVRVSDTPRDRDRDLSPGARLKQANRAAISTAVEQLASEGQVFSSVTKAIEALVAQAGSDGVTTRGCRKHRDLLEPILNGVRRHGRRARRRKPRQPLAAA